MTTIKDDTWVFLPKGTGLRGRVLFIPHDGHGGRRLVARTAVHDKLSAEGAFAHPGLVLRLGRDSESRVWVCARQPNTWELIRFQPGLALAVVVAAVNGIAVGLTATGNFFTGLKGDVSLWFVGTVFAASLLQSVSKLYKELSDATAGKAGKSVTIGVVVVALAVVVFISGRSDSPHRGGRPTTTSTRPTVPVSAPPTLPPTTATPVPSNPQP